MIRRKPSGSAACSNWPSENGLNVVTPDSPNTPRMDCAGRGAASPILCFPSTTATCSTRRGLTLPRLGALNMHGSLLPKYRGRAPVHWAIIHGETTTGASLHYMVEKPDAGALVDQAVGADPGKRHGA